MPKELSAPAIAKLKPRATRYTERAVAFMKTLVRRLRQMNELLECVGLEPRGLRGLIQDCRKAVQPFEIDSNVRAMSWTMLW